MNTKSLLLIGGLGLLAYALIRRQPTASAQAVSEPGQATEVVIFEPIIRGENQAGIPIEVASYYGRPSFIKEEVWGNVRVEYTLALMGGQNPYLWGYEHGFLGSSQLPAGLL